MKSDGLQRHRATLLAGLLVACVAPAAAQPADAPSAATGVVSYPASFYAPGQPSSAREMIERTPGFVLDRGQGVRGFAGGGGNVLIDGERPTSKSAPLDSILQRISAETVERIDVIRGGAPGIDMQGQGVVANVIRKSGAASSQAFQLFSKAYADGFVGGFVRAEANWRSGGLSAEAQISGRSDVTSDSGDGKLSRTRPGASPYEAGDFDAKTLSRFVQFNSAAERRTATDVLRLNVSAERETSNRREVADLAGAAASRFQEVTRIRGGDTEFEVNADYERPITGDLALQVTGLQRLERETIDASSVTPRRSQSSIESARSSESIGRGVLRWTQPWGAIEAGGEGALNTLNAKAALVLAGQASPVPSSNVRVEEQRGEAFLTGSYRPMPGLSLESGVRVETSTITQSGGASQEKTLTFIKPRASVSWGLGDSQIRLRIERTVGQLDFEDFAASSEFEADSVTAGNSDLEPERSWVTELALERQFWSSGAAVLTLTHGKIDEAIDLIPVAGRFDGPGNIGSGTRDEARLNLTVPLANLGVSEATLRFTGTWRKSKVTDPVTGQPRRISGQRPFEGQLEITRNLPTLKSTLGMEANLGFEETFYRINEIRRVEEAPLIKFIWDWTPRPDLLMRFQLENITARERVRTRTVFVGARSAGLVDFRERRSTRLSPIVTARARWLF
ncbi:TonB-dependent receptor plug domain-containing protein [Phenylobacterium sp.]|uniref:TonB-dependent receptor plug domain-containing protein n=1 Tax=Phenylobacterium sp. TaxID=1871053 RepID=UPI0037C84BCD